MESKSNILSRASSEFSNPWEAKAKKEERRADQLEETLRRVKQALEEERVESKKAFDKLTALKEKEEQRAEKSEKNLIRLITAVKQDKAKNEELQKKAIGEAEAKAKVAQERAQQLEEQFNNKQGNESKQELMEAQKKTDEWKLKYEEITSNSKIESSTWQRKLEAALENNRNLEGQLQLALETNKKLATSDSQSSNEELEGARQQAASAKKKNAQLEEAMRKLEEKTLRMVELVKKERTSRQSGGIPVRSAELTKEVELESTISELKVKLGEAEERIKLLQESGAVPSFESEGAAPPPPPPGAPPPPPVFKPLNLKIVKQKSVMVEAVEFNVPKPQTAIIEEIKSGVKLKKMDPTLDRSSTMGRASNMVRSSTMGSPMMPNLGALAAQLAKERNTRIATGNARTGPVRSKKLDNLLDKI